jgi:peptidoglycan hydrolase CwlO-like protein
VGILQKIVQSLTVRPASLYNEELNTQYKAQVDVIHQLEAKVKGLIASESSKTQNATVVKLERDFERVAAQANSLQNGVERLRKERKKLPPSVDSSLTQTTAAPDHYQQVQMQLQEDVSIHSFCFHQSSILNIYTHSLTCLYSD